AVNAVYYNHIQALPPEERGAFIAARRAEYAADIDLLRLASELIVDAVIEPADLRDELIRRLDVYAGRVREWPAKHRPDTPVGAPARRAGTVAYRHLLVERGGGIGRIIINRPEVRNALNEAATAELVRAFAELSADPEVRVILLRGAGEQAFCAGADLKELTAREGVLARRAYFAGVADVLRQMARTEPPIVAMVHGYALAGGCGLAAACDLVYAADDAVFGVPELHVGLFPMVVMAAILRSVGRQRGREVFFRGRRLGGH